MRKHLPLAFCLFLLFHLTARASSVCDVRSFGAKGDGVTLDTVAVTHAIATCAKQGGGTVYFGPGQYVIGTVQLQSHIRIELESGAVLMGSHNIKDYLASPPFGFGLEYGVNYTGEGALLGMLIAKNAEDISIEGDGEIDGQGDSFMLWGMQRPADGQSARDPEKFAAAMNNPAYGPVVPGNRPGTMIVFFHCRNVRLNGVTLRSAPNWTLNFQDVEGGTISDIQILNNQKVPNNDGIDCIQCRNVHISDCTIRTGDDGLAIVGSENVNVSNCSISSRSAAIRLESTKLSTFTGLSMDTNRGIAIFGNGYTNQAYQPTENVIFSDITIRTRLIPGQWWGKAEPIYIAVQPCAQQKPCGARVKHVVLNNITAEAENGSLLWGGGGSPITDVELNNIHLHMLRPEPEISAAVGGNLDLRYTSTDPQKGIIKSDIPALYAKGVAGLWLRDVHVDWADAMPDYFSDAIRVEDFTDLSIDGFAGRQSQSATGAAIFLRDGSGVSIINSRALPGTRDFLQMENVNDRRVFVNYDLGAAAQAIEPADLRFDTEISLPKRQPEGQNGAHPND